MEDSRVAVGGHLTGASLSFSTMWDPGIPSAHQALKKAPPPPPPTSTLSFFSCPSLAL